MALSLPKDPLEALGWDWSRYAPLGEELASRAIDSRNVAEWLSDWTALAALIGEARTRLQLAVDLHSDDEEARKRYYAFLETVAEPAQEAGQRLKKKLLASGLEPELFAIPLRNMRAEADLFRAENVPLATEHEKIALEYSKIVGDQTVSWGKKELTLAQLVGEIKGADRATRELGWKLGMGRFLEDRGAIGSVWSRLMVIRAKVAANAGKKDFREYVWQDLLRFDYSPADCTTFRDAIEKEVVPAAARVYERRRRRLGVQSLRPWDVSVDVMRQVDINVDAFGRPALRPFDDVATLERKASTIFAKVDPRLGRYFDAMKAEGLYDLANYRGKTPGAYCTDLPASRRPFVLMNAAGGSGDVDTLLHEMGHAFHNWQVYGSPSLPYIQLWAYPTEFAEVASMSMELLASPFLTKAEGGFYTEEEAARAMILHLEQLLTFWPFMAVMDGFQHWAYENHAKATDPAECDSAWAALWDRFIVGMDWTGLGEAKASGWQRKVHVFHHPFYYVEYGLAQLGAVQIWRNAMRDRKRAVDSYLKGLSLGCSVSLPELFAAAGAEFAFDAPALRDAVSAVEEKIAEEEAKL